MQKQSNEQPISQIPPSSDIKLEAKERKVHVGEDTPSEFGVPLSSSVSITTDSVSMVMDTKESKPAEVKSSIGSLSVDVPLTPSYTNSYVNIFQMQTTIVIPLTSGSRIITTPRQNVGTLPYFPKPTLQAYLSLWYDYNPDENTLTFCSNDLISPDATYLTTIPLDMNQPSVQHTYLSDMAPCGSNPNWNYCTPLTPGLKEALHESVRNANQTVINSVTKLGYTVIVRTPPPPLSPEECKKLSLVYYKGQFKQCYNPEAEEKYDKDHAIVSINSIWYGEIYLNSSDYFANVIGSTGDPKVGGLTWLQLWQRQFGTATSCTSLRYQGFSCGPGLVGGHVILGRTAKKLPTGNNNLFIMPICTAHNNNDNVYMAPLSYTKGVALWDYMGPVANSLIMGPRRLDMENTENKQRNVQIEVKDFNKLKQEEEQPQLGLSDGLLSSKQKSAPAVNNPMFSSIKSKEMLLTIEDYSTSSLSSSNASSVSSTFSSNSGSSSLSSSNKEEKYPKPKVLEGYDLVLMSINDKQKINLQRIEKYLNGNKALQGKPILIQQGEEFTIYGVSERKAWQLTHGLKLKASQFKEFKYEHQSAVKLMDCIQTKGGGDCALHAILGEWSQSERQLVCADIKGKRDQIRAAIVNKDNKEPLRGLIVTGIQELVMSGRNIGKSNQALLNNYRRFLSDQKDFTSELWPRFEAVLRQHPLVMEYIQKKHRLPEDSSLRDQFYDALNQNEGELYGRILSLPALHEAFQEYSQLQNTEFDWDSAISAQVKQEYADFVGTAHVWLLPSELAIIANVFHVSVIYHPNPSALPLTLNPGEQSTVAVQFNGSNHFERLQSNNDVTVIILPGNQVPKEVYQEITSKKGHTLLEKPGIFLEDQKKSVKVPRLLQDSPGDILPIKSLSVGL